MCQGLFLLMPRMVLICVYACMHACIHGEFMYGVRNNIFQHAHVRILYVCLNTCICMHTYMQACMCDFVGCMHTHACIHIYTFNEVELLQHACMYAVCLRAYIRTRTPAHVCADVSVYLRRVLSMLQCTQVCMYAGFLSVLNYIPPCAWVHIHVHTETYTYTHAHTYAQTVLHGMPIRFHFLSISRTHIQMPTNGCRSEFPPVCCPNELPWLRSQVRPGFKVFQYVCVWTHVSMFFDELASPRLRNQTRVAFRVDLFNIYVYVCSDIFGNDREIRGLIYAHRHTNTSIHTWQAHSSTARHSISAHIYVHTSVPRHKCMLFHTHQHG